MENFWYRLNKIHREMAVKTERERELGICCTSVRQQSLVRRKLTSSSSVTLLVVLLSSLAAFILQFNIHVWWVKRWWWCCVCVFLSQVKGNSAAVRHSSNTTKSQGAKTTTWVLIRCWLYLHAHSLHRHAYTLKSLKLFLSKYLQFINFCTDFCQKS